MNLQVPERIHIAPLGYDDLRIYQSAQKLKADHVVLVHHDDPTDTGREHYENTENGLEKIGIDPDIRTGDIFDMYEMMGIFGSIASEFEEDDVFINLSTGSKITSIAGMLTTMANTGITPFYMNAKYDEDGQVIEVTGATELPVYPIDPPEFQHIKILKYLTKNGRSKKQELIRYAEEEGLSFIGEYNIKEDRAKYRLLDTHIMSYLLENRYVQVRSVGREKQVEITNHGRDTVRAFEYLIE